MKQRNSTFAAFLRHRYRAHVQGWLMIFVGWLWVHYIDQYALEPLWAVLPAAFIGAFAVVAIGVAVAALLRFPWWFMAPLTLVSMAFEWSLRRLLRRAWRRRPEPRERFLSNPFALWQGWRLRRLQHERAARRRGAQVNPFPPTRHAPAVPHRSPAPSRRPSWSAEGLRGYVGEVFEVHWMFWIFSALLWIMLWLWLIEDQMFVVALILAVLLWFLGTVALLIPIAAAVLALASALFIGAGQTPLQRHAVVQQVHVARAARAQAATEIATATTATRPAPQRAHWIWPLLLGLWIGSAWGDDE